MRTPRPCSGPPRALFTALPTLALVTLVMIMAGCTGPRVPGSPDDLDAGARPTSGSPLDGAPPSDAPLDAADSRPEIVAEGLDTPWAIDFLPDGSMLITERPGRVRLLVDQTLRTVGELPVDERGESGLLGIAVDPSFEQNRFVYVYYTDEDSNRISRFRLTDRLEDETVVLDGIPKATNHDGGELAFGPDGKLYATTGDAGEPESARDPKSLSGKILRLNPDGSVPPDNPFGDPVWTYGHRNPEGIAWGDDGTMYATEHGPSSHDEINRIEPGNDYGWPALCGEARGVQPLRCITESTLAPAGIAVHGDDLYVAGLRGSQLHRLTLADDGRIASEVIVIDGYGRLREVVVHEGHLYFTTSNRDGRGVPRPGDDHVFRLRLTERAESAQQEGVR